MMMGMKMTTKKASVAAMTNEMRFDFDVVNGEVDFSTVKVSVHNELEVEELEDICDYCGEELGFCAPDCETKDPDFEENW